MGNFFFYLFMVLFILVCIFMILLVLIQKGRGGGLASAFGGAGGNTAFGSKTGDVLTWATSIVFGVFLLLAIILNLMSNSRQEAADARAMQEVERTVGAPTPAIPDADTVPIEDTAPATQP
jgi:preprotein translocase subunit SecG